MPLYALSVGDIALVTFRGRLFGQTVLNTFHYRWMNEFGTDPTDGPAQVLKLAQRAEDKLWLTHMKAFLRPDYQLDSIQTQVVYPTRRVFELYSVLEQGTNAVGPTLPPANTAVISRYGSLAGRGRTASLQLSGISTNDVLSGNLTDAAFLTLHGIANDVGDGLKAVEDVDDAWLPINWSRVSPASLNYIRSADGQRSVRTQKRRVVGRGI